MRYVIAIGILAVVIFFTACSPAEGNRRGHEFMPDMVHPTGYEANLFDYYYYNRWGTEAEYKAYAMPRFSVPGTIPRGQVAFANKASEPGAVINMDEFESRVEDALTYIPNGGVPYYYGNTEPERSRAMREITRNPFPITTKGLESGKVLYEIYCGICHGVNGDGQGYLVREADPAKGIVAGVYPAAPANLMQDTFVNASAGRIYHAIMHGKNVMGSYADKLSYQERWDVIHYLRSLQAKAKKLDYTETSNTFNHEATPWAAMQSSMAPMKAAATDTSTVNNNNSAEHNTNRH